MVSVCTASACILSAELLLQLQPACLAVSLLVKDCPDVSLLVNDCLDVSLLVKDCLAVSLLVKDCLDVSLLVKNCLSWGTYVLSVRRGLHGMSVRTLPLQCPTVSTNTDQVGKASRASLLDPHERFAWQSALFEDWHLPRLFSVHVQ